MQNLEKWIVLWTDFSASCREINRFSVSKISPEPAKLTISLALLWSNIQNYHQSVEDSMDILVSCHSASGVHTELQIRGSTEDNSKIIFLISQRKHML